MKGGRVLLMLLPWGRIEEEDWVWKPGSVLEGGTRSLSLSFLSLSFSLSLAASGWWPTNSEQTCSFLSIAKWKRFDKPVLALHGRVYGRRLRKVGHKSTKQSAIWQPCRSFSAFPFPFMWVHIYVNILQPNGETDAEYRSAMPAEQFIAADYDMFSKYVLTSFLRPLNSVKPPFVQNHMINERIRTSITQSLRSLRSLSHLSQQDRVFSPKRK
jgi:hypothetical protein